jgi:hypothetical protein
METIALDNSVSPLRVVAIAVGESDVCCRWKLFGFTQQLGVIRRMGGGLCKGGSMSPAVSWWNEMHLFIL